jgi:dynein heavy chain
MDAVCVLLDKKTGWPEAVILMKNPGEFILRLQNYDKDSIPPRLHKKLKKYTNDARFTPELIKKKSVAGESICCFCLAMDKYADVKKIVEPKEAKLKEAMAQLEVAQADLKIKQTKL